MLDQTNLAALDAMTRGDNSPESLRLNAPLAPAECGCWLNYEGRGHWSGCQESEGAR